MFQQIYRCSGPLSRATNTMKGKEKMGIVYIVTLEYTDYEFMSGSTALSFAELALTSALKDDIRLEITLKAVPNKEDEPDNIEEEKTEDLPW